MLSAADLSRLRNLLQKSNPLRALGLIELIPKASLTIVCSRAADLENSEETFHIKWLHGGGFQVTSPDNGMLRVHRDRKAALDWLASAGFRAIAVIQLEAHDTHFAGEREIATLSYMA
ncbi:hypothetical protein OEZ85_011057 [Tetradesmus obliquus]|uniref:Uncharacterized protein n=1 Tax=Tetradesmus obliquus TaxID=3088 RepID=A0ABY8TT02_TETOB|nr:hypothetical protein OEZ85_011057 [Tetradesmus obliquus]